MSDSQPTSKDLIQRLKQWGDTSWVLALGIGGPSDEVYKLARDCKEAADALERHAHEPGARLVPGFEPGCTSQGIEPHLADIAAASQAHEPTPVYRHTLDCDMVKHRNCTRCSCGSATQPPPVGHPVPKVDWEIAMELLSTARCPGRALHYLRADVDEAQCEWCQKRAALTKISEQP